MRGEDIKTNVLEKSGMDGDISKRDRMAFKMLL